MSNLARPEFNGGNLESSPAAIVAVNDELNRRNTDANRGTIVHLLGGVFAMPALVWLQPEQEYLRTIQAAGLEPMKISSYTGVSYWLQQAANLPVDYKSAAFATAVGTATYGARLVSRRHRFPIDEAKAYEQLIRAESYDPSQAKSYATRRKIGDVAVGTVAAGAAYAFGERLDIIQALVATTAASMGGFAAILGSKIQVARYKAKLKMPKNNPIERPELEDGKTIY